MKLTDLETCKRIAEIDKVTDNMFKYWRLIRDERGNEVEYEHYNPLTDDTLCFQLMVKYKISFEPCPFYVGRFIAHGNDEHGNKILPKISDTSPNKAILLAIIEAHNESN